MKEYLNNHPEVKAASREIQKKCYDNYEKRRLERIITLKKIRNELIKAESSTSSLELQKSQSCMNITSYLLKKRMDKLEQMKKHQIYEIKELIDYKLQHTNLCNKIEEKQKQYEEKEELIRQQKNKEEMELKLSKRLEEREREERIEKEELESICKIKELKEEELEWKEEDNKRRKRLENESQQRKLEHLKHQEEIQKKLDQFIRKRQNYNIQKQKESELKDEIRKKLFEERRIENTRRSFMHQQIAQEKLCRTFIKNEEESLKKRLTFEEKQMKKEKQIIKNAEETERKNQEQSIMMKMKKKKIDDFSNMNEKLTLKKINVYDNRSEIAERNRREREKRSKEEFIKKIMRKQMKERDNYERRSQNDASLALKHSLQLERSYLAEEKVRMQREKLYQASIDRFIEYSSRYEENIENIRRNDRKLVFRNQLKLELLYNKNKKVEELLKQKNEITEKTKSYEKEISKRKEEIISKVNKLLETGKIFTRDQMYYKVFTPEEYNTLSSRTVNQMRSGTCSPNISCKSDITPSNIPDEQNNRLKNYDNNSESKRELKINKYKSITPINETYDNNNLLKDRNLIRTPNNNDFFMTQNQFNSLNCIFKK